MKNFRQLKQIFCFFHFFNILTERGNDSGDDGDHRILNKEQNNNTYTNRS